MSKREDTYGLSVFIFRIVLFLLFGIFILLYKLIVNGYQSAKQGDWVKAVANWALPGVLIGSIAVASIVGAITAILDETADFTKDILTPYDSVRVQASAVRGGGENGWGWTIFYKLDNQSSKGIDLRLGVNLPVRFYDCLSGEDVFVHFKASSEPAIQTRLEPNEWERGRIGVTYAKEGGWAAGYYMCWKTPGCINSHGCRKYEIQTPSFFILRENLKPLELKVDDFSQ